MRLQQRHTMNAVVPTSAMADTAFLLIIFFMWTYTVEVDKAQITVPQTALRFEIPKDSAYTSITEEGQIRVSAGKEMSVPVSPEDVSSFAAELVSRDSNRPVVLKADRNVPYKKVDHVIDALKQGKVRLIYLLTKPLTVDDGSSSQG